MYSNNIDDHKYAKDICREFPPAVKLFHSEYSEKLLFTSKKFVNTKEFHEGWQYTSVKGYVIIVTDEISDTYVWLVKQLIKKCCKYSGKNDAKLNTYLIALLNSTYTFNDWLKWKYGSIEYIPKPIRALSNEYWDIFRLLRRRMPLENIEEKLKHRSDNIRRKIEKIKSILSENNLIYLIETPLLSHLLNANEDVDLTIDIKDENSLNPESFHLSNEIREVLSDSLNALNKSERRILQLYWGMGMSTRQIFLLMKNDKITNYDDLNIKHEKDIYKLITVLIKEINIWLKSNYKSFHKQYDFNETILREVVKIYLSNFLN